MVQDWNETGFDFCNWTNECSFIHWHGEKKRRRRNSNKPICLLGRLSLGKPKVAELVQNRKGLLKLAGLEIVVMWLLLLLRQLLLPLTDDISRTVKVFLMTSPPLVSSNDENGLIKSKISTSATYKMPILSKKTKKNKGMLTSQNRKAASSQHTRATHTQEEWKEHQL